MKKSGDTRSFLPTTQKFEVSITEKMLLVIQPSTVINCNCGFPQVGLHI